MIIMVDRENKRLELVGRGNELLVEWLMLTSLLAHQFAEKAGIAGYLSLFGMATEEYERIKDAEIKEVAEPIVLNVNKEQFAKIKKALGIDEDVKEFYIYPKDLEKIGDVKINKIMERAKIKTIKVLESAI